MELRKSLMADPAPKAEAAHAEVAGDKLDELGKKLAGGLSVLTAVLTFVGAKP